MNRTKQRRLLAVSLVGVLLAAAGVVALFGPWSAGTAPALAVEPAEATSEQVHQLCAVCHAYPPPDTFPRSAWRKEVVQGYDFFHEDATYRHPVPHLEAVVRYYERRAPESLDLTPRPAAPGPCPARLEPVPGGTGDRPPGVAHVSLVRLTRKDRPDILACDALGKRVLVADPTAATLDWREIASGVCCARAEVVDLDGDGVNDVLLAVLGSFYASDDRTGRVVWLRGKPDGTFTPVTLLDGLGRVADVRAADFTGDGKLDLVVGEFGWHRAGGIRLLVNRTTDWSKPTFENRLLDDRHGTTHVPVGDLNGDGKPDFVAVISQEHELAVAFVNTGDGTFRKEPVFTGPHPTYGTNGGLLVDLDGDGDLDLLFSNGDSLDAPYLLRPDHGLTWLENTGKFPFVPHRLADVYGCGSPVVADFDGNGLPDVAVCSFLPKEFFPQRAAMNLDAVVLLSQTAKGKFDRYPLEAVTCDHLTCAAGDLDGDGRPDLVVGNFVRGGRADGLVKVWKNATEKKARP